MSFWKNPVENQHGASGKQVPYGMTMPKIWKMSFWKNPVENQHGASDKQVPYGMTVPKI